MKKLPKTPSKLLAIALTDLVKIEKSKKYKIDMSKWHRGDESATCQVCLAGAVMAKTLKGNSGENLFPLDFGQNSIQLEALNDLRSGDIDYACEELNIKNKYGKNVYIPPYEDDPTKFKKEIRQLIKDLQKVGM